MGFFRRSRAAQFERDQIERFAEDLAHNLLFEGDPAGASLARAFAQAISEHRDDDFADGGCAAIDLFEVQEVTVHRYVIKETENAGLDHAIAALSAQRKAQDGR